MTSPSAADLASTPYIDSDHLSIVAVVEAVTADARDDRERAVRLHDFVRDEIRFGWAPAFYDQKASDVLRAGIGFCNTKSTLFLALLRAAGIPARQRFVDIDTRILDGLVNPGTPYVDHSYSEVWLDGRWLRVDSYILDRPLADAARTRLVAEGRVIGYGAHRDGVSIWDGASDAFSQFVDNGAWPALGRNDHGVFADVGAFYASGRGVNKLNVFLRLGFGFFSRAANDRIAAIRDSDVTGSSR
ncbi:MAG: transglutaminase-like domain-containing protein [Acidobacteriota bacterium]